MNLNSLRHLIERRSSHQVSAPRSASDLKHAVFSLISTHTDLDQLLKEVSPESSCIGLEKVQTGALDEKTSSDNSLTVSGFINHVTGVSEKCGQDLAMVAASICVSEMKKLLATDTDDKLLPSKQKIQVEVVIAAISLLHQQQQFNRKMFIKQLNKCTLPLEIILCLHTENIMPLDTYITCNLSRPHVIGSLTHDIIALCSLHDNKTEQRRQIVSGYLVKQAFGESKQDTTSKGIKKVCLALLDSITKQVVAMTTVGDVDVFDVVMKHADLDTDLLIKFCTHQITQLLSSEPNIKVSQALMQQERWTFARSSGHMTHIYKQLLLVFEAADVVALVTRILEQQEVNWQAVLSFVATFLVCHQEAAQGIADLVASLLQQAFRGLSQEPIITAFLLIRQASLEGPHVFMSYSAWFQNTFGDPSHSLADTKKTFVFLMKFLSDIVPYESAAYLKAHLMKPPHVPAKCRPHLSDYIVLAKTRLADLKEPFDQLGIYDQGMTSDKNKMSEQVEEDVNKALSSYEKSGKVPASVMEASIFRKPYYINRFLPALLTPRPLPDVADTKMHLIQALRRAEKIPPGLYSSYEKGCQKEADLLLGGVFSDEDSMEDAMLSPTEQFHQTLDQLPSTILTDLANHGAKTSDLPGLLSVLSEKIHSFLGTEGLLDVSDGRAVEVDLDRPSLSTAQIQVAEGVLNIFCKTVAAVSAADAQSAGEGGDPWGTHRRWSRQFVTMLSQHVTLMCAIVSRTARLLTNEGPNLSLCHVNGLALFMLECSCLSLASNMFVYKKDGIKTQTTLADLVFSHIQLGTQTSMQFALRLCTVYLHHILRQPRYQSITEYNQSPGVIPDSLILMFQFLAPRNIAMLRQHCIMEDVQHFTDQDYQLTSDLYSSDVYQNIAKSCGLTLKKWIEFEFQMPPSLDLQKDQDRSSYYHWLIHEHFVPLDVENGGCGGSYRSAASQLMSVLLDLANQPFPGPEDKLACECASQITGQQTSWLHLVGLLQSLVPYLSLDRNPVDGASWMIQLLCDRMKKSTNPLVLSSEITTFFRIAEHLPASLLFVERLEDSVNVTLLREIIAKYLREYSTLGTFLPLNITSYLIRGLLLLKNSPDVENVLGKCPLITVSMMYHWRSLESIVRCHTRARPEGESAWNVLAQILSASDEDGYEHLRSYRDPWFIGAVLFVSHKEKTESPVIVTDLVKNLQLERSLVQQVTEWWLVFVLAEVVSHDVTKTQQRSCDHLISTARQILSVCPFSVECATSGKQHIVMEIVPPLMLRLLPVAASRAVIETKHALWVKGHCRLMLGVYADCVSLFDHMVTDENTKQRGLYEQILTVEMMKIFSDYVKTCVRSSPSDVLLNLPLEITQKCDEDIQILIKKRI